MLAPAADRKSTRLNSSHVKISYAVFCLKKKNQAERQVQRIDNGAHLGPRVVRNERIERAAGRHLAHAGMHLQVRIRLFFFNDTATTEIYTLSLHDALPISPGSCIRCGSSPASSPRT